MIERVYFAAKKHKKELLCTITTPSLSESTSASEKLGIEGETTTISDVLCVKSQRRRTRESSDTGIKFVSVFSLLINASAIDGGINILMTSTVDLLGRSYRIFSLDHNLAQTFWRVDLRDE